MGRWGTRTYVNCRYVSFGHSANCADFICVYFLLLYLRLYAFNAFVLSLRLALQHPPPLNKEERERTLRFLSLYKPFFKKLYSFFLIFRTRNGSVLPSERTDPPDRKARSRSSLFRGGGCCSANVSESTNACKCI